MRSAAQITRRDPLADFRFVTKPFEVGREMTATYKLKRHVIAKQYASLIDEIFPKQHAMPAK